MKEDTMLETVVSTAARNASIWHANRMLGVGTARLAANHGLSRQRIKQIIAREDQKRSGAPDRCAPSDASTRDAVGELPLPVDPS
jgi:hypothetical protein